MSFQVTLKPSAHQFPAEADTTLLQAALDAELIVPYGCKDGACGSCKAKLLSGEVDHGRSPDTTLPAAEREAGTILMCCASARSDVSIECRDVRSSHDIPLRKLPTRVTSMAKLAHDVMQLNLKLPATENFRFHAGQYIDFLLADGKRRSFSMANPPHASDAIELHVRYVSGGFFTEQVFGRMKERDILRIEGPFGSFFLRDGDKPVVFLAGGTGFAPLKSIIEDMAHRGLQRPVTLYWGSRDRAGLYMHELAEKWAREHAWFKYVPVISDMTPAGWTGRGGLAHEAVMADLPDLSAHEVYACGSPAMIEAARHDFVTRCQLPQDAFFADAFTYAADSNT